MVSKRRWCHGKTFKLGIAIVSPLTSGKANAHEFHQIWFWNGSQAALFFLNSFAYFKNKIWRLFYQIRNGKCQFVYKFISASFENNLCSLLKFDCIHINDTKIDSTKSVHSNATVNSINRIEFIPLIAWRCGLCFKYLTFQ